MLVAVPPENFPCISAVKMKQECSSNHCKRAEPRRNEARSVIAPCSSGTKITVCPVLVRNHRIHCIDGFVHHAADRTAQQHGRIQHGSIAPHNHGHCCSGRRDVAVSERPEHSHACIAQVPGGKAPGAHKAFHGNARQHMEPECRPDGKRRQGGSYQADTKHKQRSLCLLFPGSISLTTETALKNSNKRSHPADRMRQLFRVAHNAVHHKSNADGQQYMVSQQHIHVIPPAATVAHSSQIQTNQPARSPVMPPNWLRDIKR